MNDAYVNAKRKYGSKTLSNKCSMNYKWVLHQILKMKTSIYLLTWVPHEQASFNGQIRMKHMLFQ